MNTQPVSRCPGPVSRRSFLQLGALGFGGLGLGDLLRARGLASGVRAKEPDTAVILIWLPGGPPHMETYDMKPDAPAEYRGEFRPIPTTVPGMEVCELLPRHAAIARRFNLVRSIAHEFADHGGGHKRFLTGRIPASPVDFVNDSPAIGSIVAREREHRSVGVPNYIAGADDGRTGVDVFSFGAAYLGQGATPFIVGGDPSLPTFKVQNLSLSVDVEHRLDDRARLLQGFDRLRRQIDASGAMGALDEFNRRALELLTSLDSHRPHFS